MGQKHNHEWHLERRIGPGPYGDSTVWHGWNCLVCGISGSDLKAHHPERTPNCSTCLIAITESGNVTA